MGLLPENCNYLFQEETIMTKKIIAALMALVLLFAFAACGSKTNGDTTTTEADTIEDITSEDITEEPATDATEASATDASATDATEASATDASATDASATDASSADASESETETTEAPKAPQTKAEIVAYFNDAVNGIKKDAKSATRNYSKISLAGSTKLPGWANTAAKLVGGADKFIDDQLAKNSKGSETFTGSQIKETYPVEGESWASKLTEADVKSATCTESNGKYTITIVTVNDNTSENAKHGSGHAPKAFNVPLPATINENVPGFAKNMIGGSAAMEYPSSTYKIVVDAKTGHVESANTDLYWTIHFGTDTTLPFRTQDSWTIKY